MVEAALGIANAMMTQFLPELSAPLSACGTICNTTRMTRHMAALKLALYPENQPKSGESMLSLHESDEKLSSDVPTANGEQGGTIHSLS